MKKPLLLLLSICCFLPRIVHADPAVQETYIDGKRVAKPTDPGPLMAIDDSIRPIGVAIDLGVPDGLGAGIVVHPFTNAFRLETSMTGALSFGFKETVVVDPFDWDFAPTLALGLGHSFWTGVPGSHHGLFSMDYFNAQVGLEYGRRSRFRWHIRAGFSHLWIHTFRVTEGLNLGPFKLTDQPKININVFPSINIGLSAF